MRKLQSGVHLKHHSETWAKSPKYNSDGSKESSLSDDTKPLWKLLNFTSVLQGLCFHLNLPFLVSHKHLEKSDKTKVISDKNYQFHLKHAINRTNNKERFQVFLFVCLFVFTWETRTDILETNIKVNERMDKWIAVKLLIMCIYLDDN